MLMEDDLSDSSESFYFEDEDSDVTIAQVLSFIVASHNMNAQACALFLELRDLDDDNLPDILEEILASTNDFQQLIIWKGLLRGLNPCFTMSTGSLLTNGEYGS